MKICYVDESGCTGRLVSSTDPIQPILVIGGLIVDVDCLHQLTNSLILLKKRFFPGLAPSSTTHMGWVLREIKGADLRRDACSPSRKVRRHTFGYLGEILKLVAAHDGKLVGRVWVKGIGVPFNGTAVYTYSLQSIYRDFQNYLEKHDAAGVVILDARLKHLNTPVAHSIFTQKFKATGDAYDRIIELPAFSHSDNHAGLQIADTICSAVLTPMCIQTYCEGYVRNIHVRPGYSEVKRLFKDGCCELQHRYRTPGGPTRGGFVVSDALAARPGGHLFR